MSDDSSGQFEFWRQVEDLFHAALEYPPDERSGFLDRECGGDTAVRSKIDRLLARDENTSAVVDVPAWGPGISTPSPEQVAMDEAMSDQLVGPYRLQRLLGAGGMGAVWLAERADAQYDKQVAIKLIKRGMDTDEILARFRNERQVLANLEHPNIARLLDGGVADDDRPYLVMERVEGAPINTYCDEHKLDISERLQLFRDVCAAVQYAHQNLVVHRDLKPSNILVTEERRIKLLDFGIAKVIGSDGPLSANNMTSDWTRLMTPRYASPEQVCGGRITTASDVYSLGIVLYELLTGHDPYDLTVRTREEYERAIREHEPRKPSTVATQPTVIDAEDGARETSRPETRSAVRGCAPRRLRQRLAGDLDTIVLTALNKDVQRRYASAEAFSNDIRRHLENLPIAARPDSWGYRTAKFIRRNRAAVAALVVTLVTVTAAAIVSATMYLNAESARESEAEQRSVAEEVSRFVNGMLQSVDPRERGLDVTVRELLDEASARVEADLGDSPAVERGVRLALGLAYRSLGLYDDAMAHLRRALALDIQLGGEDHRETAVSMTELAQALRLKGEHDEAESLFRRVLKNERQRHDAEQERIADAMNNLALLLYARGEMNEAGELYRRAFAIYRAAGEEGERVAHTLDNLAGLRYSQGDYAGAEALLQEAYELNRDLVGPEHPDTVDNLNNLAGMLMMRGRYADAESRFRETLELRRESHGPEHPTVALTLNNLAESLRRQRRFADAEPLFEEALAIRRARLSPEHPAVASTLNNLANTVSAMGEHDRAVDLHREALAIRLANFGDQHPQYARSLSNLAHAFNKSGDAAQAEELYREALAIRRATLAERHPDIANTLANLADVLTDAERYEEAEPLCREALAIQIERLGEEHPNTGHTFKLLGRLLTEVGRFEDAEAMLTKSHRALAGSGDTTGAAEDLVRLFEAWGKPGQAAEWRDALPAGEDSRASDG